jgi:PPIC-type PPIASE domain
MNRILREPLLHFLLLGAAIFMAYSLVSQRGDEPGHIVIPAGQVAAIELGFTRTWHRPPTREELEGLIRDRVREEVYYREALALGLDKDDTIIRRRLRQKLEFLTDDVVAAAEPTDAELNAYLAVHPDSFRLPSEFTFSHVYLNPDKHGVHLVRDTAALLARLNQARGEADVSALGDAFLLGHTFAAVKAAEVATQFGKQFAAQLAEVSPGQWQGPVQSGYGVHLVLVSDRTEGRVPRLDEVRDAVAREWDNARRLVANDTLYLEMLKRYAVVIEIPRATAPTAVAMGTK